MFGIPNFDLLSDRGKQEFIEYVVNLTRKEINSYTPNYNNVTASTMLTDASLPTAGTAGTYTKVTTDVYGRVVSGTTLIESDIPALSPSKITGTAITAADTGTVTSTMILNDTIINADINASAAIAYSKLNLGTSIVNTDIATGAAIAYSKLNLATSIVNADISASAAIDKTKISGTAVTVADTGTVTSTMILDGTILNADINASAAIAPSKISGTAIVTNDASYLNPAGSILAYAGINTPTGWLLCAGQDVSRTTYATLFAAISTSFATATTTNTSTTVSGLTDMATATHVGWGIAGNGIPTGATISSVTNTTTVVISAAATVTATGTASLVISPYKFTGANNTTTFLVPDLRGRTIAGKDNMAGSTASRLTSGVSTITGTILGNAGGNEALHQHTHTQNSHNHTQNSHNHTFGQYASYFYDDYNDNTANVTYGLNRYGVLTYVANVGTTTATNIATTATNQNTGTGFSQNVQPTIITNYIIKT